MPLSEKKHISNPKRLGGAVLNGVIILGWLGLVAGGFGALIRYEAAPGPKTSAPAQLSHLSPNHRPSLILALHPKCPCSRATVGELEKILARAKSPFSITILAFKPKAEPDSWIQSSTLRALSKMGAEIVTDTDGARAEKLGLATSGQFLLYSVDGQLLFNGGITAGRGHSGDNVAEDALLNLLNGHPAPLASAPVFGCTISDRPQ